MYSHPCSSPCTPVCHFGVSPYPKMGVLRSAPERFGDGCDASAGGAAVEVLRSADISSIPKFHIPRVIPWLG